MTESRSGSVVLEAAVLDSNREAFYGQRVDIPVHTMNMTADTVVIERVTAALHPDQDVPSNSERFSYHWQGGLTLQPRERRTLTIPVVPPLDALPYTNYFHLTGEASTRGARRAIAATVTPTQGWLLLKELPPSNDSQVFVSFKDPEDEGLASLATKYLARAGFRPYRARDDTQIGVDYWTRKIFPAIENSSGVLVIWTQNTQASPEAVRKEITHARDHGIPIGLFLSTGSTSPPEYPASILEHFSFDPTAPHSALADGIGAVARQWSMGRALFSGPLEA